MAGFLRSAKMKGLGLAGGASILAVPGTAVGADAAKGEALFKRCAACHSIDSAKKFGAGPNLGGIVGRKAGTTSFSYSPALKASGFTWTPEKLDAFLEDPAAAVPGNKMIYPGMSNAADRANLIAFLSTRR